MSILPVNNVVNVTVNATPQGLAEKNVNSLALFTNEASNSLNAYEICLSAKQVAEFYGTNSVTAQMANAIFSQSPNIRTGNGRLVVIPMLNAVSATVGDVTTPNISANLAAIIAVTSGDLRVIINAVNYDLTDLNFTNCVTFADIATVLQARLVAATVTATANGIKIESKKVGTSSTVTLAAVPAGSGTALNGSGYFNAASATTATGVNSSGETIAAAIARTGDSVGYVGMLTTLMIEDTAMMTLSNSVQAMDRMFHYASGNIQDLLAGGIGAQIEQAGNDKTRFKVYTDGIAEARLFNAAYAGRAHSVNFSGSLTSQTMWLKQLATIEPDLGISQTFYENAKTSGVDLYVSYDGLPSVMSNGANNYFDQVYSRLALKFALETAGFNFLRQTNTKIPQTESGMNGLKNAYAQVMERFLTAGYIAPGTWNSSETFGDPVLFRNNITNRGYYIYSLPIAQQAQNEREERKAPLVQIAAKEAGAIHTSDVIVLVNP